MYGICSSTLVFRESSHVLGLELDGTVSVAVEAEILGHDIHEGDLSSMYYVQLLLRACQTFSDTDHWVDLSCHRPMILARFLHWSLPCEISSIDIPALRH